MKTVAVLYPGEMGAAIASVLRAKGIRVVTTLGGRSEATAQRCRQVGIEVLPTIENVVRESDLVLSVVSPSAAEAVAEAYCNAAAAAPANAMYVDVNSIRPELAKALEQRLAATGRSFADAAINGLAKNLTSSGTLFLSGRRADEVATVFRPAVRVKVLGNESGRASAMKMLLAGVSKGVCALFAELSLLADRQGMLDELLEATSTIYPEVGKLADRMLPTYIQHSARRATEMQELEQTQQSAGITPCVVEAVREFHELLAQVSFGALPNQAGGAVSLKAFIQQLSAEAFLAAGSVPSAQADSAS